MYGYCNGTAIVRAANSKRLDVARLSAHYWFEMIAVVPSNFVMLMVNGSL